MNFRSELLSAIIRASSIGVYVLKIDDECVDDRLLSPGFTSYNKRTTYQEYDVTEKLKKNSTVSISVGPGWAVGSLAYFGESGLYSKKIKAICEIELTYADGKKEFIGTDGTWEVYTHCVTFSDIYHGETVDLTVTPKLIGNAEENDDGDFPLVLDNGEPLKEQEYFAPMKYIVTPKGERVIDFGQNMAGYVTLKIKGNRGERVVLSFAEVLDSEGNFYNANYRASKNIVTYILSGKEDFFKPQFSFQGFRYIRIDEYPDREVDIEGFVAVAVYTDMKRIGNFVCGNEKINQLYHNIIWGQKSNYFDIPIDSPQRDERLGWLADAQVFCKVAGMNYDILKFIGKWFENIRMDQRADGALEGISPLCVRTTRVSAGWADAVTIIPWTLYELYGDKKILEDNFELMRRWVEYIHSTGDEEYLWLGGYHYGDWLAMDVESGSYVGSTSNDLIASAFFAYSTELLIKSGEVLGKDMSYYRTMYSNIVSAFREYFMENGLPKTDFPYTEKLPENEKSSDKVRLGITQTALVLILQFNLCTENEKEKIVDKLCELIEGFGGKMSTGFIGTPYILHALSDNGRTDIAYKLLFNEETPSWLYSVNHGATTMWEHWDGIKEDKSFWSTTMNSFNHYAYGAVGDWLYGAVSGIKINDGGEGYTDITVKPLPDQRLGFARTELDVANGKLISYWYYKGDGICFEFVIPQGTKAKIILPNGYTKTVCDGRYNFEI